MSTAQQGELAGHRHRVPLSQVCAFHKLLYILAYDLGIVALLNDARTTQGLPVLGFLNPMLYSLQNVSAANTTGSFNGTGLNDITIGSNPGCGTNGFNTSVGWDAVTGLGSPNFAVLLAQLTGNTTLGGFLQI